MSALRVGVLISGRGSNLKALIDAQPAYNRYAIAFVLSNAPDAPGLAHAQAAGIPWRAIDHRPFGPDRAAWEREADAALRAAGVELVALAGFMRVLTPWFIAAWAERLINIHPSLLPAFKGLDTHARALAAGVRLHGCSVHRVSEGVDEGAILAQAAVPVLPGDDAERLAARVLAAEHRLYPATLAMLAGAGDPLADGIILSGFR